MKPLVCGQYNKITVLHTRYKNTVGKLKFYFTKQCKTIANECPLTKYPGGIQALHAADEELTKYPGGIQALHAADEELTKYPGGIQALHAADEDAIEWLHKFSTR